MTIKRLNHIQRQFVKYGKLWVNEKDPKKKAFYYKQFLILNNYVGKEKERC